MSLSTVVTTFRWILVVCCLAIFGTDCYFVKIYNDFDTVTFRWNFPVQMGLSGLLLVLYVVSAIAITIQRRRSHHSVKSAGTGSIIVTIIRGFFVVGAAGALLAVNVNRFNKEARSMYILPFGRDTPQGRALNKDYTQYDEKNLFNCPDLWDNDLQKLCSIDRTTIILSVIIGVLAIIEAGLTFRFDTRRTSESDFDHSQHVDLEQYGQQHGHGVKPVQYDAVPLNANDNRP
ncbi:hypothetical protein EC968_007040 [Mortierella alpina]|nr:hypothetical protein EC968_007040 [Mortierella alpina]